MNWVSDADIKGFFDNVCHERLVELLRIRISDPRLLTLIERFLKARAIGDESNWGQATYPKLIAAGKPP